MKRFKHQYYALVTYMEAKTDKSKLLAKQHLDFP